MHVCCVNIEIFKCIILCGRFFFQAEDGIRDLVRSRGLGDVYKRQAKDRFETWGDQNIHVGQSVVRMQAGVLNTLLKDLSLIHI